MRRKKKKKQRRWQFWHGKWKTTTKGGHNTYFACTLRFSSGESSELNFALNFERSFARKTSDSMNAWWVRMIWKAKVISEGIRKGFFLEISFARKRRDADHTWCDWLQRIGEGVENDIKLVPSFGGTKTWFRGWMVRKIQRLHHHVLLFSSWAFENWSTQEYKSIKPF